MLSAPAASTAPTSSPSRAKSAERMEGAIQGVAMRGQGALFTGDRHLADEHRAAADGAARVEIAADSHDVAIDVAQVSRDRDLLYGIRDGAVFDPEAAGAARIVPGHAVDSLAHQLRHEQSGAHAAQQRIVSGRFPRSLHDEIVNATRVARGLQSEAPRRVASQHIALEDSALDQLPIAGGAAFVIEGGARQTLRDVRPLVH